MAADDLLSIADELYASPIEGFTASRNARAAEIKKAGNADLATRIRALGKPTAAAAAANLLVRTSSDALTDLATLRERIEAASLAGDRDELRAASRDRQSLVSRLVADAAILLDAQGRALSAPAADELGEALLAALGDADIALALATGRLIAAPRTGGMSPSEIRAIVAVPPDGLSSDRDDDDGDEDDEAPGTSRVRAVSPGGRTTAPPARTGRAPSSDARATRRRLERDLAAAESADDEARADRTRRTEARDALEAERDEKKDEATRRRDALRLAERELDDADDRLSASDADIRSRELQWKRAEASVRRARQALDAHEDDAGA